MNRNQFFHSIAQRMSAAELQVVQQAYSLAKDAHREQSRNISGERYFEHLRRVALMPGDKFGVFGQFTSTLVLGLLHDVLEDTYFHPSIILSVFGDQMYRWCMTLSKEYGAFDLITGELIGRTKKKTEDYYAAIAATDRIVRIVKLCDRIDNLQDLPQFDEARRKKYVTETETYVLPIAAATDRNMEAEIERLLSIAPVGV